MRMLDAERGEAVRELQLYLTPSEASVFVAQLQDLLADPEKNNHHHLFSGDGGRELSFSIVTPTKLATGKYTKLERQVFDEG